MNKLGWEEILKRPFDYPDEDRLSSGMKDYIRNWAKETFDALLRDGKKTILYNHDIIVTVDRRGYLFKW